MKLNTLYRQWLALAADLYNTKDERKEAFEYGYRGEMRLWEYVRELYLECDPVPDYISNYVDWEWIAKDLLLSGEYFLIFEEHYKWADSVSMDKQVRYPAH